MQSGSWSAPVGGVPSGSSMTISNTENEINDYHSRTYASKLIWPFVRYDATSATGWTGFWLKVGNMLGNTTSSSDTDQYLVVQWSVLPTTWWL